MPTIKARFQFSTVIQDYLPSAEPCPSYKIMSLSSPCIRREMRISVPGRDTNIRLNSGDAFLMNQRVGETNHLNDLIPRPLCVLGF
ncbi:hypothetical protein IFM5058_08844 [Aspergillus udagawae]|nr:hypothetical protein IFM5058_08844 [Aspergillus udagawae]